MSVFLCVVVLRRVCVFLGDCCPNLVSVPERSKGVDSSSTVFALVGSNPTADIIFCLHTSHLPSVSYPHLTFYHPTLLLSFSYPEYPQSSLSHSPNFTTTSTTTLSIATSLLPCPHSMRIIASDHTLASDISPTLAPRNSTVNVELHTPY